MKSTSTENEAPLTGAALATHYDGYYSGVSEWRKIGARDKAANIRMLWPLAGRDQRPRRVVEMGCGEGAVAADLMRTGFAETYAGYDISASGVAAARAREVERADFQTFDGVRLPAEDRWYDLAILSHVVEHLEHPRILLAEAKRVAQYVIVEVPLELNLRTPQHFQWNDVGHINLYSPLLIRHLLESCGLEVLAEQVTCPQRAVYQHGRPGARGAAVWAIKAGLLRMLPQVATRLLVYHNTVLCRSAPEV
jgi:SAM-dependent methyltransferase